MVVGANAANHIVKIGTDYTPAWLGDAVNSVFREKAQRLNVEITGKDIYSVWIKQTGHDV